jgi:hypothetical protein
MHASALGLRMLVLVALPATACEAVPALTFAEPDASTATDGAGPRDAGNASDAGEADAMPDARPDVLAPTDGATDAEAGCPGSPPMGASVCCGAVACDLNCVPALCTMCEAMCKGKLCCAKNNNVMCAPMGMVCH